MTNPTEPNVPKPDTPTMLALDRTRLAHDRTLLAWIRTAASLITFGFGIDQIFRSLRGAGAERIGLLGPREFGLAMIACGLLSLLIATIQNRREMQSLRAQYPGMPRSVASVQAALIATLGLLAFFQMLLRQRF